jgi:pimeloyl-ACP methyl ester carboxylesterase
MRVALDQTQAGGMTQHTTTSDGLRVTYDDSGTGAPALVFIHGAFANRGHYAPQLEYFSKRRRVIVPDLRGHGDSETPGGAFGINEVADDVIAVCRDAGVERAVLCSHSWPVSLVVAEKQPSLVEAIVMFDGAVLVPQVVRDQLLQLIPVLEGPGWVAGLQGFLVARNFPFRAAELKARVADEIANGPARMAAPMVRDTLSEDWSTQIAAGTYPLLYVHGAMPLDVGRLRELRPDVVFAATAGSGHYMTLEVPAQVNAMLDRFLDLIDTADASNAAVQAQVAGAPA